MENKEPTNIVISEQPVFCKVQTPLLTVCLSTLVKDSPVYDASGKIQRVLSIEPTGVKSAYKVTFSDGSQMDCSEDHELQYTIGSIQHTKAVKEFLTNKVLQQQANFPLCKPVERMKKKLFGITPEIMGILLRDSTKMVYTDNEVTLIISNSELEKLTGTSDDTKCTHFGGDAKHTTIVSPELITELKTYLVAKHPQYRVIPDMFLRGSIEQRKELLNSIGYYNSVVNALYRPMANSIQALAEGLGYSVSVKKLLAAGCSYYSVKLSEQPRKIIDISYAYRANMLRIITSGKSGKYLTDNHIT